MFKVLNTKTLAPKVKEISIYAPRIACSIKPGQFVIVMVCEECERIPLSVVEWDCNKGIINIVFQEVGVSTYKLGMVSPNSYLYHVVGPLGAPTHIEDYGTVTVVAGGVAIAASYPVIKAFKQARNKVISIIGARSANLLVYKDAIRSISDELYIATDDGSEGFKGYVSQLLDHLLEKGLKPDVVWIIGSVYMMKSCVIVAKKHNLKKIIASLNPIMVCGMGMCGACRVNVGNSIKFACVDGPEFNALEINWDELENRLEMYKNCEKFSLDLFMQKYSDLVS